VVSTSQQFVCSSIGVKRDKQVLSPKRPGELWMYGAEVHHCWPTNPLVTCILRSHGIYPAGLGIKQQASDNLFLLPEAMPCSKLPTSTLHGARPRVSLTIFLKTSLYYVWIEEFQVLIKKLLLLPLHIASPFFSLWYSPFKKRR